MPIVVVVDEVDVADGGMAAMLKILDLGQCRKGSGSTYRDDSASRQSTDGAGSLAESRSEHCVCGLCESWKERRGRGE